MVVTREHINEYVDRHWSVLPISQGKKSPAMQKWTPYTEKAASIEQLYGWFDTLTGAGIGVVTGKVSGIVVIDVESYCNAKIDDILAAYPTGLVAKTGGGGWHLYYRYPESGKVGNKVRLYDGVDIRGEGGFIVLPPTRHKSGNDYTWYMKGEPGEFPKPLIDRLQEERKDVPKKETGWVTDTLRGVGEGSRNHSCARLAGYFASKQMPEDVVKALLMEWNAKNIPPLSQQELMRTVESVYRSYHGNITLEPEKPLSAGVTNQFDLASLDLYAKRYAEMDEQWLIKDWLVDKSVTFVVSPPESYKTWLLLDLAVSVASGAPFMGVYEVAHKGSVFIIQQEDAPAALLERITLIAQSRFNLMPEVDEGELSFGMMPDLPIYFHTSRKLKFGDLDILKDIEEHIVNLRPSLILIDPLYSATDGANNYMADLANQMMILKDWRDKYGCSFVIAHHSRKSASSDDMLREDAWGSQFINAFLEAGWQIRRDPKKLQDNQIFLRRHSKVTGNKPTVTVEFNISTNYPFMYQPKVHEERTELAAAATQVDITSVIKKVSMSQAEIARETGYSKATVSRQIRQLIRTGVVVKLPDGKFTVRDGVSWVEPSDSGTQGGGE